MPTNRKVFFTILYTIIGPITVYWLTILTTPGIDPLPGMVFISSLGIFNTLIIRRK